MPRSISMRVSPASTANRCTELPSRRLIRSRASSQTALISSWLAGLRLTGSVIRLLQSRKDGLDAGRPEHAETGVTLRDELLRWNVDELAERGDDRGLEIPSRAEVVCVRAALGLGDDPVHDLEPEQVGRG